MASYIDVDLLLQDIHESVVFTVRDAKTSPELRGARKIIDRIKSAPTADVEEVKYSEWELCDDGSGICKNCNTHQKAVWDVDGWQSYCGRCGAKMDGERK